MSRSIMKRYVKRVKERLHEAGIRKCPVSRKVIAEYLREGASLAIHHRPDGDAAVLLTWPSHLSNMIPAGFVTTWEQEESNGA